ncbi:MAG: class I SAM-dependent methyltransferase [Nannocystaceae bacterium]|nr:class I SAM-dependent methyltransferase [Nannocystaceae bacterium]
MSARGPGVGAVADDNIVGNHYDKYGTRNPIARALVRGFLGAVTELYRSTGARSVLEVGCGEGLLAQHLWRSGPRPDRFVASDVELDRIAPTLEPAIERVRASIYELPFEDRAFDLVVCCEVLEHVTAPARGVAELARVAGRHVLISAPWEPVWRALNLARGRYVRALGNTPGHIQHFSRSGFIALAREHLRVTDVRTPLPWTVLLGQPRR